MNWMNSFVHPEPSPRHRQLAALFRVDSWVCACDSRTLVAMETDSDHSDVPTLKEATLANTIHALLTGDPTNPIALDRDNLLSQVGPYEATTRECSKCHGSGEVDHHCDCHLCEEDTEECDSCDEECMETTTPDIRNVRFKGVDFDGNRIAQILERCPPGDVMAMLGKPNAPKHDNQALYFYGDRWRAVLMCLTGGSTGNAKDLSLDSKPMASLG